MFVDLITMTFVFIEVDYHTTGKGVDGFDDDMHTTSWHVFVVMTGDDAIVVIVLSGVQDVAD
jgi:hypothetical protein